MRTVVKYLVPGDLLGSSLFTKWSKLQNDQGKEHWLKRLPIRVTIPGAREIGEGTTEGLASALKTFVDLDIRLDQLRDENPLMARALNLTREKIQVSAMPEVFSLII